MVFGNNKISKPLSGMIPRSTLITILFIVFLDVLGLTLIAPILAPIFLDKSTTILASSVPYATRTILLGLLLSAYPIAQFFGSPLLGALSDRYGRKRVLFISLGGCLIGFVLFSYGLIFGSLELLFISRVIEGFTAGAISVALSSMADLSTPKTKTKNFGLVGAAYGLGFVVGPILGFVLSDNTILPWFTHATPFLFGAVLTFINMIMMLMFFPETLKKRIDSPISLLTGCKNIIRAFSLKNLRTMFIVVFFITLGFTFFVHFLPLFLIEKFHYSERMSGLFFAYAGFWLIISQGFVLRWVSKKFSSRKILSFSIVCFSLSYALFVIPSQPYFLYWVMPIISLFIGLTLPTYNSLISDLSDDESQGEVMGISQSMQALGTAIPPIIGGFVVAYHPNFPIVMSFAITFVAWLIFMIFYRPSRIERYHEL
ncbi:MAG: MFS transporter [Nanoarchaeota archaeon]